MASPDGVPLYSRFDFKAIGEVWTERNNFTGTFRKSRPLIEEYARQEKQAEFLNSLTPKFKYRPESDPYITASR
jgi:hypothetical protein